MARNKKLKQTGGTAGTGAPSTGKRPSLHAKLRSYGQVLVAFSGGVDSTYLLYEAVEALGPKNVAAATAVSETYTPEEKERAVKLCRSLGVRHRIVKTKELANPRFARNDPDRCYYCKKELISLLTGIARGLGIDTVVEASHTGDSDDFRPGARAVAESDVRSPLVEAGYTKADIRRHSHRAGLPTADLPAAACLASRIPYGTPVTAAVLKRLARGEAAVRNLGFRQFRLRHHGDVARLEFDPAEMERAFRFRRSLHRRITAEGWSYVALDLTGYRTGSLNETLDPATIRKKGR